MNALMRLNRSGLGFSTSSYLSSSPVHAPVFTMFVDVDGTTYEASDHPRKQRSLT